MKDIKIHLILKNHFNTFLANNTKKTFFIHIPKNAGTAFTFSKDLNNYLLFPNIFAYNLSYILKINKEFNGKNLNFAHGRFSDFRLKIKNNFNFIAVIRNPWSRVVSRYRFGLKTYKQNNLTIPNRLKTFECFIDSYDEYKKKSYYWHKVVDGWFSQKSYIDSIDTDKLTLLRFEYLNEDLNAFFLKSKIDLKNPIIKRINKTSSHISEYKNYYNQKLIEKIYDIYKEDIEYFNFDFDTSFKKVF